ncbi:angiopoietin-2b [Alosa sapidissima]|uniref:angiopoietin-2b n=1 Tax=Alosa sapidissima TaxID=34773 RepID=UPI001C095A8C|nr:angiopoietin-2b [Alosa sapidissima]
MMMMCWLFILTYLSVEAVAAATTGSERRQHQVQHGKCSFTFVLPEVEGCGGEEEEIGGRPTTGEHQVSNALQRDSPPPPGSPHSALSREEQERKLETLESVTDNNTQWLLKLESYIQESVLVELQELQRKTMHSQTATMLEISTNLLSHSTQQSRKLMDVETQVLNQTGRLEIQLLEYSLSTARLEKHILLQANELARLNDKNRALEQRFAAMEARHAEELRAAQQEKGQLQALIERHSRVVGLLEGDLALTGHSSEASSLPRDEPMVFRDCAELYKSGITENGVYSIRLSNTTRTIKVLCDMETLGGGWTVLQRRLNGSVDFHRGWRDYKQGFGSPAGEHWLGNSAIHQLTTSKDYSLLVLLRDAEGNEAHSLYEHFHINDEDKNYSLHARGFSGTAGKTSSLTRTGTMFSTKDRDNDFCSCKCAQMASGGWWFEACGPSNLNGMYYSGVARAAYNGIKWYYWKGPNLKATLTSMMVRPADF